MKKPANEKEALMRKIQAAGFAAHECVLYLDNHASNKKALERHSQSVKTYDELKKQYESEYGPIGCDSAGACGAWDWVNGPWPWQAED